MITIADKALKALSHQSRDSGSSNHPSIPYMRVNYSGEIAAQGLYLGAALFEKNQAHYQFYLQACDEESLHLDWCGERVAQLGGRVSRFNMLWFLGGFFMGAGSRVFGSGYALGFVEETEHQVLSHLHSHLKQLPVDDEVSRGIVQQMIIDEQSHGSCAKEMGAKPLPEFVKSAMHLFGRVLTGVSYFG